MASRMTFGSRCLAIAMSEVQLSVPTPCATLGPPPGWIAAKYTSTVPRNASAMPTEHRTTYFHDASRAPSVRRCPTRNVVAMVVASTATHSTPRFAASTAPSMQVTKTWTSTA